MDHEELNRIAAYRQLKKEIRGSKDHVIVGIDIDKDKHHALFGTATGKGLLRRVVFPNDLEGFEKLLVHLDSAKVKHGLEKVVFGFEPTANYHKSLGEHLIKCGFDSESARLPGFLLWEFPNPIRACCLRLQYIL